MRLILPCPLRSQSGEALEFWALERKPTSHQLSVSRGTCFGIYAMTSWASFPEIVWQNSEASWQQASWHPPQHFMISGTPEKQAKLPPQMAISLLFIRSSVYDSEINIFIGSPKFQLDLQWTCTSPASTDNNFFYFYMGLANSFWCSKSLPPSNRVELLHHTVLFVFREPVSPHNI